MKTSKQTEREARQLFRFCVVRGKVDEWRARLVIQRVLQSRRRGYLFLLGGFRRLLEHEFARSTAEIESAVPLPTDLLRSVQNKLTSIYGRRLTWSFSHNSALIGGMRIKVGSDVYDSSVRSGLAALARSFGITSTNGRHGHN